MGTATEVYDFLRLLWARVGKPICRSCGAPVRRDDPESATAAILATIGGQLQIAFPLVPAARTNHQLVVENLAAGYLDPLVGGGTKDFAPYVLMILMLMFRPYGIFGKRRIERV